VFLHLRRKAGLKQNVRSVVKRGGSSRSVNKGVNRNHSIHSLAMAGNMAGGNALELGEFAYKPPSISDVPSY
jgi:hypothetical protein